LERDVGVSGAGRVCALPHGAADGAGVSIEALAWYARGFGLGSINVDTFAEDDKGTHGPVRAALTQTCRRPRLTAMHAASPTQRLRMHSAIFVIRPQTVLLRSASRCWWRCFR
jgi:hypothetical protein